MQVATQSRSRYWWRAFVDTLDVHDLDGELVGVAINIVYLVFVQAYAIKFLICTEMMNRSKLRYLYLLFIYCLLFYVMLCFL